MKKETRKGHVGHLSKKIYFDPVTAPDGYVYEREYIERDIEKHGKSTFSGMKMTKDQLVPSNEKKGVVLSLLRRRLNRIETLRMRMEARKIQFHIRFLFFCQIC